MANMTVSGIQKKASAFKTKMRTIVYTHTDVNVGTGTVDSAEDIHGTLLRIVTDAGGDAAWNIILNDGIVDIWTSASLGTGVQTIPLGIMWDGGTPAADTEVTMWGIPITGKLTCSTSNLTGSGTGPVITIIFKED